MLSPMDLAHSPAAAEPRLSTSRLAALAIVGVLAYIAIDAFLAFARPDVNLVHDPESDYGHGAWSWLMDANFVLRGALSLAIVAALGRVWPSRRSRWPLVAIGVWAVASALLAFFADDLAGGPVTTHGKVHVLLALIAFVAATAGSIGAGWTIWRAATWRVLGAALLAIGGATAVALVLTGRSVGRAFADGGLEERIFLGLVLLWIGVAAVGVRRVVQHRGHLGVGAPPI
jgi:hypothetical protein